MSRVGSAPWDDFGQLTKARLGFTSARRCASERDRYKRSPWLSSASALQGPMGLQIAQSSAGQGQSTSNPFLYLELRSDSAAVPPFWQLCSHRRSPAHGILLGIAPSDARTARAMSARDRYRQDEIASRSNIWLESVHEVGWRMSAAAAATKAPRLKRSGRLDPFVAQLCQTSVSSVRLPAAGYGSFP